MIPADDSTPPAPRLEGPGLRWQVRGDDGACDQDAMRCEAVDGRGIEDEARAAAEAMRGRFTTPGSRVELRFERTCGHLHTDALWTLQHDGRWTALLSVEEALRVATFSFVVPFGDLATDPPITSRGGRA